MPLFVCVAVLNNFGNGEFRCIDRSSEPVCPYTPVLVATSQRYAYRRINVCIVFIRSYVGGNPSCSPHGVFCTAQPQPPNIHAQGTHPVFSLCLAAHPVCAHWSAHVHINMSQPHFQLSACSCSRMELSARWHVGDAGSVVLHVHALRRQA
jgi:hypothetical protein